MTTFELKAFHNRTVSITFDDGEIATARLTCMREDCEDVMVDILGTDRPERYARRDNCSYIVPASELLSVVELSDAPVAFEVTAEETEALRETMHLVEPTLILEVETVQPLAA